LREYIKNVFGWKLIDYDADNWFVMLSQGEDGKENIMFKAVLEGNEIAFYGFSIYRTSTKQMETYGDGDVYFGIGRHKIEYDKGIVWIYGDKDKLIIVNKNMETGGSTAPKIDVTMVYIGRFIPAYEQYKSEVILESDTDIVGPGVTVQLKVEDATKFIINRCYVICDTRGAEKVTVVNVDTSNNTITVDQLKYSYRKDSVETADLITPGETYKIPIVIGEMPKPYVIADWWKCKIQSLYTNVGNPTEIEGMSLTPTQGKGHVLTYYEPTPLIDSATVDELNNDRYMFETYFYSSNPSGFYGKPDLMYELASSGIVPEADVLNDKSFLYRVFQVMGIGPFVAIKEQPSP
jgi:hypothetical protein